VEEHYKFTTAQRSYNNGALETILQKHSPVNVKELAITALSHLYMNTMEQIVFKQAATVVDNCLETKRIKISKHHY
jgi:hypothetical protein